MSLQDSEVIKKIEASAKAGKTPELVFLSKWLRNKKINEKKYDKNQINDFIFSRDILASSYFRSHVNNVDIIKLKNEMERMLRDDYGYELSKKTEDNELTDNTKWSKPKFEDKIKKLTENISMLRSNFINSKVLDKDYVKKCDNLIEEIESFINNSEVCHESTCFISSNDISKKKQCPKILFNDCKNNYEGTKLLYESYTIFKNSDSLAEIDKCLKEINDFIHDYGKYAGKGFSIVTHKVQLMEKKCKILLNKFVEEFRKTKCLEFSDLIKSGDEYLKEIKIIKDELEKEEGDYSAYRIYCKEKYVNLEKAIKSLKQDDNYIINDYKDNIEEIISLLKLKPVGDSLDEAIKKATELVDYWKDFGAKLDSNSKIYREYEKDILKKLNDLKKESEEYEGSPEGFSKDLEIFDQTLTVQIYASEKNIVSSFFDNIKKWLHLG